MQTLMRLFEGNMDNTSNSFQKCSLYVIAGSPMMGKSTLIYNLMMDMKSKYRVLFIKTELCHNETQKKLLSALGDSLIYKIYMDLNELKEILREETYDYIFIDCFQCMDRKEKLDYAKELKKLAGMFNVGIIIGSSIPQRIERRKNRRPKRFDMIKSHCDSLWKAADEIIFIYRESYYNSDVSDKHH